MAWQEVIYHYDGSFDGLLCCVFESYVNKELPIAIVSDEEYELSFFSIRQIVSDSAHARRIYMSLRKISPDAASFLRRAHLTDMPNRDLVIYRFIVKLYRERAPLLQRLTDEDYLLLRKAVRHLSGEAEAIRGFLRFSDLGGVLAGEIEPKNRVLPLLRSHFCSRYHGESFFIYDRTHHEALLYSGGLSKIVPLMDFQMAAPDAVEASYRTLWRRFYDTIAIRERENAALCRSNLPKRYRGVMTEFQESPIAPASDAAFPMRAAPNAIPAPATPPAPERSAPV